MSDTQWPRWEVFKQDNPRKPHQAVGTVHAGDAETALLEARNVFVRRPSAVSLWVCPAQVVYARTAEQLADEPPDDLDAAGGKPQPYLVFRKASQRRAMTFVDHVGEVMAVSPQQALARAIRKFQDETPTWVWWIVPAAAVTLSQDADADAWFAPALDKKYRQQSAYGFVNPQRRGRGGEEE